MLAGHDCYDFGMAGTAMPADGVVTGVGYIDGNPVAAFSQDFMVGGGALGKIHSKKICALMKYAMEAGMPLVGINDSGGARIQEGGFALSGYGQVFFRNVLLSGRGAADLDHRGSLRRGSGLFAGPDRLHHHDARECEHVHLRTGGASGLRPVR